ncbi:MAG: cellulase family glycosylhydrolase [Bacteroidota bacterium]
MKRFNKYISFSIFVLSLIYLIGCKKEEPLTVSPDKEEVNILTVSPDTINFQKEGGSDTIIINTGAGSWNISKPASDWLVLSSTGGTEKTDTVTLSVNSKTIVPRSIILTITAGNAKAVQVVVSQPSSDYLYSLSTDTTYINLTKASSASTISISTDAPQWNISSTVDWLQYSQSTGAKGNTSITVTSSENTGSNLRSAIITVSAQYTPPVQISVTQTADIYPNYNTAPIAPDAAGMSSTAVELAAKITLGLNIGNTLEAIGGETAWGNPRITKSFIGFVKQSGFTAVRLPCSWNQYMANSSTAQLKTDWLDRVKDVIQYCVDNDLYVLLNIHWDGGWLENNCTVAKQAENNAKQRAFWEQIATQMRGFDEHLLFAGANEPNVSDATQMAVLMSYHQTFINAVRSTGGKNSYRVLVVQGPSTDIDKTNQLMQTLPTDKISNRMMVEIHYYTPWNFCGLDADASWGKMFYYWGKDYHSTTDPTRNATWGEESSVDSYFQSMKTKFVDKGIPVVLGEFSAIRRSSLTGDALTLHLASRAYYFKYVTKQAKANGLLPYYWDTGSLLNRNNNTVLDQQALDALIQGATN